jgi:hypothetical protein
LHKAEGYQIRNIDDNESEGGANGNGRPSIPGSNPYPGESGFDKTNEDLGEMNMSLIDQVFDAKWKVRWNAFKKINHLFVSYQPPSKERMREDEMYGDPENPFDQYGNVIE